MVLNDLKINLRTTSTLPKYQQLADCLEEWIVGNGFVPGTKLPSDRQLSEHFGTTAVTISKGLNELTRKGVLKRKVGSGTYVAAAQIQQKRRIGVICHEVITADASYVTPVMDNFYRYWQERSYQVISLVDEPKNYEKLMREYELSGIMVFVPREEFSEPIKKLYESGVPVVSIGFAMPDLPDISFGTNHCKVGEQAVAYLHGLGHRRIGVISSVSHTAFAMRRRGYANGMWNAGLPVKPDWIINAETSISIVESLKKVFSQPDCPTAFLITSIYNAMHVYNVCNALKIKIPEDVSLVGFNDADFVQHLSPPLTVFAQRTCDFTLAAARQLERMIQHEPLCPKSKGGTDAELIERGSCQNITIKTEQENEIDK